MGASEDIFRGAVCRCSRGIVGVIDYAKSACSGAACGTAFYGHTLDGEPWQSVAPDKLADSLEEYEKDNR